MNMTQQGSFFRRLTETTILLMLCVFHAHSTQRALLVGVGTYPHLDPAYTLKGPPNDVRLMRSVLMQRGFDSTHILTLSDSTVIKPDRANILKQLALMADSVKKDDIVYIHFSGHGGQAPTTDLKNEPDGFDEFFLARDAAKWDDKAGVIPGAIMDDEIGAAFDRIRSKGATVISAFDACHSGTMTRGIDSVKFRFVPTSAFAVPHPLSPPKITQVLPQKDLAPLVAFYAVASDQKAPEAYLPMDNYDTPRDNYGLLSFTLASALLQNMAQDYAQLGQQIAQGYRNAGFTTIDPMVEGSLDLAILQKGQGTKVRQWPMQVQGKKISIQAGILMGISQGQILRAYPQAESPDSASIFCLQVKDLDLFKSNVATVKCEGDTTTPQSLPDYAWIRMTNAEMNWQLTYAIDSLKFPELKKDLQSILDSFGLKEVSRSRSHDISISLDPKGNWQLRYYSADGDLIHSYQTPNKPLDKTTTAHQSVKTELSPWLIKLKKYSLLGRALNVETPDTSVHMQRLAPHDTITESGTSFHLAENDSVIISYLNTTTDLIYLNLIYMNPTDLSITVSHFSPKPVPPGGIAYSDQLVVDDQKEKVVVAVVGLPVDKTSPDADLSLFSQSGIVKTRGSLHTSSQPFTNLFMSLSNLGDGTTTKTRGLGTKAPPRRGPIKVFSVQTN